MLRYLKAASLALCLTATGGATAVAGGFDCDRGNLRQTLGVCADIATSAAADRTDNDRQWTALSFAMQQDRAMPTVYSCVENALIDRLNNLSLFGRTSAVGDAWLLTVSPVALRKCDAINIAASYLRNVPRSKIALYLCSESQMLLENYIGEIPDRNASGIVATCASVFAPPHS